jgi:hypothetical protein
MTNIAQLVAQLHEMTSIAQFGAYIAQSRKWLTLHNSLSNYTKMANIAQFIAQLHEMTSIAQFWAYIAQLHENG